MVFQQRQNGHDASHPIKIGSATAVFALSPLDRRPFFEGRVRIEARCEPAHHYRVRFYGERVMRTRFVHPDWQSNADRSFALLLEFWRANASPGSFEEFFPEETM